MQYTLHTGLMRGDMEKARHFLVWFLFGLLPIQYIWADNVSHYVQYNTVLPTQYPIFIQASSAPKSMLIPSHQLVIGTKTASLSLSGFVNSMVMNADDGKKDDTFFVSNPPISRITVVGKLSPNQNWVVGGRVQLGFNVNLSSAVSQVAPTPTPTVDMRIVELFVKSKHFGSILLGKGSTATDNIAYSDFSGTMMLARATLQDIGGGLFYRNTTTGALTDTTVGNTINGLDGFGRAMRLRYDSPAIGGLELSGSVIENARQDIALKFGRKISSAKVAAQIGLTSPQTVSSGSNIAGGHVLNVSAGILLKNGINVSASWADLFAKQNHRDNPHYFYLKPGYRPAFFSIGQSALSADIGRYYNFSQNKDRATGYGAQVAQSINAVDLVVYAGYRRFHLDRTILDVHHLNLFLAGAIVKF